MLPLTSIIIPTKNAVHFMERCIWSLLETVDQSISPLEIIIIDNGSTDGMQEFAKKYQSYLRYFKINPTANFSEMNNFGVRKSQGKFLLFLNNDTEMIQHGWLVKLHQLYGGNVGILGVKQLYPNQRTIYHAGMVFDWNRQPTHLYPDELKTFRGVNRTRDFQMVNGACMFMSRENFDLVHGFDDKYVFGYEDCDLCFKVRAMGKRVVYTPEVEIIHFGQGSGSRAHLDKMNSEYFFKKWNKSIQIDIERYYKADFYRLELFYRKWRDRLEKLFYLLPVYGKKLFHRGLTKKLNQADESPKLLVDILDNQSSFDQTNRQFLKSLEGKAITLPRRIWLRQGYKKDYCLSWNHYWDSYGVQRPNQFKFLQLFAVNYEFPSNGKVIDPWVKSIAASPECFLPISSFCENFLIKAGVKKSQIFRQYLGYSPEINSQYKKQPNQNQYLTFLIIINSFDLKRNGFDIFVEIVTGLSALEKQTTFFKIKDYGMGVENGMTETLLKQLQQANVRFSYEHSFVPKQALLDLYKEADAFIAPFRGEGFGMKILDAMAMGLPVLAPNYGGITDYAQYGMLIKLPFKKAPMKECYDTQAYPLAGYVWCEVDIAAGRKMLQEFIAKPLKPQYQAIQRAAVVRKTFSWEKATSELYETFRKLKNVKK